MGCLTLIATPVEPAQPLLQGVVEVHSKADIRCGDGIIKFQYQLLLVIELPDACICAELSKSWAPEPQLSKKHAISGFIA